MGWNWYKDIHSSQCSTTDVTGCDIYYPACGLVHKQITHIMGFVSCYWNGPLPYVRCHITVNKNVMSVLLNKTFPSFPFYTYLWSLPKIVLFKTFFDVKKTPPKHIAMTGVTKAVVCVILSVGWCM